MSVAEILGLVYLGIGVTTGIVVVFSMHCKARKIGHDAASEQVFGGVPYTPLSFYLLPLLTCAIAWPMFLLPQGHGYLGD